MSGHREDRVALRLERFGQARAHKTGRARNEHLPGHPCLLVRRLHALGRALGYRLSGWQRFVDASVVSSVGHSPVHAVVVSNAGKPGEGFAAVVSSAERIDIRPRCWTAGDGFVVVEVAAVGRDGAGRIATGAGSNLDSFR